MWVWYQRKPVGRCKDVTRARIRSDELRAFFHGSVDVWWKKETMPMDDFGAVGAVGHLDGDGLAFAEAQERPRYLAVVGDSLQ